MARILVVEDDPAVRDAVVGMFRQQRCEVLSAHDGHEAVDVLCEGEQFDLVISDVDMPSMDGLKLHAQVCEMIRKGRISEMPFALMSGGATFDTRDYVEQNNVPFFLKPFGLDMVHEIIRTCVP